ncbi:hypothetical protein [Bremerella alba]|uniref:Uncharacterized protein n=1 Tax=Bremerella alba TaxID=980252 RepID=A0A7V8V8U2_9BACT|nr:hypothetical protein [Bremerella alba]MBA2116771.1 hypothetical protein [Bremerella alba]
MATFLLTLFLLIFGTACCGLGGFGLLQHSRGQKFLLPQKVCMGLTWFGIFTMVFVATQAAR